MEKESNTDVSESRALNFPPLIQSNVAEHHVAPRGHSSIPGTHNPRPLTNFLSDIFKKLGILDKLLSPLIILFMILGVVIGEYAPHVQQTFDVIDFHGVSVRESISVRLPKRIRLPF